MTLCRAAARWTRLLEVSVTVWTPRTLRLSTSVVGVLLLAGLTAFAARSLGTGPVRLDLGGFEGEALAGAWSPAVRAGLRPEEAPDGRRAFYFRRLPPTARVRLPVTVSDGGTARVTLRAIASPRCVLDVFSSGRRVQSTVTKDPPLLIPSS